jgi:ABC-type branched-subunit amino acid transport system permease subunit
MSRLSSVTERAPGSRLAIHAVIALVVFGVLTLVNQVVDPLMSYYLAAVAMYATAMFGMTILVGLSGQVSLGNGALMAVGGYIFALTSLNWQTVPILGTPWNAVWSMVFAGIGGVVFGLLIGGVAARLRGPYLAGLTLGIAVGVPAVATRFPGLLGGENGLMLQVPYPAGGYAASTDFEADLGGEGLDGAAVEEDGAFDDEAIFEELPDEFFQEGTGDDLLTDEDFTLLEEGDSTEEVLTDEDFTLLEGDSAGTDDSLQDSAVEETVVDDGGLGDAGLAGDGVAADTELAGVDSGFLIEQYQASIAIAVACIVGFVALNLVRGRQGRVWQAVRDDPIAAAVTGISPSGSKVSAFVISSLFAALAGAVFVQILSYVGPGAFSLGLSLSLLVGIVLGGRNSLVGAVIGAAILVWLPEFVLDISADRGWGDQITNYAPNLIYGLLVVLVVLAVPGGLVGGLQKLGKRFTRN